LTFAINLLPWILRIYGIKTITTFHEIYAPSIDQWTQRMLAVYNHVKDTALLWGSAVSVLTVSQRRDRLAGRFPGLAGRLYAMPVGAGVQETPITDEESQTERQKLGVAPEEILLGSFGSMHVDRRYDTLFRALRALIDQGRRTRLALIGAYSPEHAYFRYLKKVIADLRLEPYIIWTGYGEAQTVSRWLALLDIYIMTDVRGASDRKSSLVSALAHGLPVISTRGEDTASHFVHGENILLFSVDDENELKNQIDRLLLNADERKHLGEEARCLYNVYYSWEGIAQQTIKAYGTDETGSEG
jgi:glycosyltransferase involved in cell wall biosynthesis